MKKTITKKYKPIFVKQTGNITWVDDLVTIIIFGVIFFGGIAWIVLF